MILLLHRSLNMPWQLPGIAFILRCGQLLGGPFPGGILSDDQGTVCAFLAVYLIIADGEASVAGFGVGAEQESLPSTFDRIIGYRIGALGIS